MALKSRNQRSLNSSKPANTKNYSSINRVGFDFDKVFVSYPPVIPDFLIDFLYKGGIVLMRRKRADKVKLTYRMPGFIEQKIRVLSHFYIFRPPLKNNIHSLRQINKNTNHKIYLVSSRFGFLKNKTYNWLDKNKLRKEFDEIHFNFNNLQPHIFKAKVIKKCDINYYIDDDLDLLVYLSKKMPSNKYFWLTNDKKHDYKSLPENIKIIKNIKELYTKYL